MQRHLRTACSSRCRSAALCDRRQNCLAFSHINHALALAHFVAAGVATDGAQGHLAEGTHHPCTAGAGGNTARFLLPPRGARVRHAGEVATGHREQAPIQCITPGPWAYVPSLLLPEAACSSILSIAAVSLQCDPACLKQTRCFAGGCGRICV